MNEGDVVKKEAVNVTISISMMVYEGVNPVIEFVNMVKGMSSSQLEMSAQVNYYADKGGEDGTAQREETTQD